MSIQTITFDVGGTLIQPWPSVGAVYARVATDCGLTGLSADRLTVGFRAAWRQRQSFAYTLEHWKEVVLRSFGPALPADMADRVFREIYRAFARADAWRVFDDVPPVLRELKQAGYGLAVVSNWDDRLRPLLRGLGLDRWFDAVVVSGEEGVHKPDPALFHCCLRRLGVSAEHVVHVGDSREEDWDGARQAGCGAVWLRRGEAGLSGPQIATLTGLRAALEKNR